MNQSFWQPAPEDLRLHPFQCHVWMHRWDRDTTPDAACLALLDESSRSRANRFRRPEDRRRFLSTHATLRVLLSRYLGFSPAQIQIGTAKGGKPRLELNSAKASSDVRFNLSHSGGLSLMSFALGAEVGVDVEQVQHRTQVRELVERWFSPREQTGLLRLPESDLRPAFFRTWACKEAYLKGLGEGLLRGLGTFSVETNPVKPAALIEDPELPESPARWRIQDIPVDEGYVAAISTPHPHASGIRGFLTPG